MCYSVPNPEGLPEQSIVTGNYSSQFPAKYTQMGSNYNLDTVLEVSMEKPKGTAPEFSKGTTRA